MSEAAPAAAAAAAPPAEPAAAPDAETAAALNKVSNNSRDKVGALLQLVRADAWDVAAWLALRAEVRAWPAAAARSVYEEMLTVYPMSAATWCAYVDAEHADGHLEAERALFSRCLLTVLDIDLWRKYLRLIKSTTKPDTATGANAELQAAYEFAITHVGQDYAAGDMWREYVGVLKEEGAKTTALRRAFQQAVVTPMEGVDALWREWELFENNLDRNLAKPLLAEYSSRHVSAKGVLREITRLRERVHASALAVPPAYAARVAEAAAGTDVSARVAPDQSAAWDDLLAYERGNPLRLEDGQEFGRMTLAYNQCLCALAHYPRVWLELHKLYADRSDAKGAREVLVRAVRAVPSCLLVHFALADYDESRGKVAAARATYDALLAQDGSSGVLTADKKTLAYIQLMRFARRSEGAESARKIFLAARKDSDVSYHVFVASAHMEYRVSKDAKVARNIFELGLRTHLKSAGYVLAYADFLAKCLNDDNNARGLFERALAASEDMSASDLRRVWNGFMEFEAQVGNMAQYNKVQARRAEAMQEAMRREGRSSVARRGGKLDGSMRTVAGAPGSAEDGLHLMLERHAFGDLRAATPLEAGITRAQCEALGISGGPAAAEGGEGMQAQAAQGSGAPGAKTPSPLSGALGMLLAHLPPPGVIMPPVPDPAVVMSVVLSKDIPVPVAGSAASRIATPDVVRAEVSARAAQQNAQQQQASQQQAAAPGGGYGVPPQGGGGNYAGYQGGGGRGDDRRGGGPPSQQDWSSSRKPGTEGGSYGGDDRRGVKRERYDNGVPEHDVFRHRRGAGTQ